MKFLLLLVTYAALSSELPKSIRNINTLYISFKQKMKVPIAEESVSLYKGELFYKKGLKFLWRYTWGSKDKVISNGNFTETFINGKCQISPTKEVISAFPLLEIFENPNGLSEKFKVEEKIKGKWKTITLVPKRKGSFVKRVTLLFKSGRLEEVVIVQSDGTEQTYLIEKFVKNVKIPDSTFRLEKCN